MPEPAPRRSRSADAAHKALVERARARTPEERILLALELGARGRIFARASATPGAPPAGPSQAQAGDPPDRP